MGQASVISKNELLGEIVGADAAVDLWLVLIAAAVAGVDEHVIRVLSRTDSSTAKVSKIKQLLSVADQVSTSLFEPLNRVGKLKDRRDEAVHSYYVEDGQGRYSRHRVRSASATVEPTELEALRDEYSQLLVDLENLELVLRQGRAVAGDASELLRDCFEILAAYRLDATGKLDIIRRASESGELVLTLFGQGRFELGWDGAVDPIDAKAQPRAVARINLPNGRVHLTMRDGREVSGGDTGWRNVLEQVRSVTPDAQSRFWRRTNEIEQYVSDETDWWPPAGLDDRLTSESARELIDRLQRERQTFLPDT